MSDFTVKLRGFCYFSISFERNYTKIRFMVKPHTSDIMMTYEYIRVTYEYIQVTYEYIRVTYG